MKKILFALLLLMFVIALGCSKTTQYQCYDGTFVSNQEDCPVKDVEETSDDTETEDSSDDTDAVDTEEAEPTETDQQVKTEVEIEDSKESDVEADVVVDVRTDDPEPKPIPLSDLSREDIERIDKKLLTQKVGLAQTVMPEGIYIGESFIYPMGFKNTFNDERDFRVRIRVLDGRSLSNSQVTTDQSMVEWFTQPNLEKIYTVAPKDKVYLPLEVTIGEFTSKDEDETKAGKYKVMLTVEERKEGFKTWNNHGDDVLFYVWVSE